MNYSVQAKLLRFLQDHEIQRVGAASARPVDVRVIAATNRDPKIQIDNGKLREDFYYRLSVVTIELAPLRDRAGDTGLLVRYFLDLAGAKYGRCLSGVSPEAMEVLESYNWPGNVRQLEHVIDQVVITTTGGELAVDVLPEELKEAPKRHREVGAKAAEHLAAGIPSIQEMERELILRALRVTSGSVHEAAKHLGLSEATLYRKIKKYGLSRLFVESA
jgi:transcriptional regulator with PAS, ATPase and Fis domain